MEPSFALEQTTAAAARVSGDAAVAGRIGRFALLRQIGAGAMGVVFAAYDEELDRRVAIKLMRASEGGSEGRARMLREARRWLACRTAPFIAQFVYPGFVVAFLLGWSRGSRRPTWPREVLSIPQRNHRIRRCRHSRRR